MPGINSVMPSIKTVETIAGLAADAASKALPSKLAGAAAEALAERVGSNAASKVISNPAAAEILGSATVSKGIIAAQVGRTEILKANEALVRHVTDLIPQVQKGRLDWILGGSTAVNALASARKVTILDASRLPSITPGKTQALPELATSSYGRFVRKVDDIDAFVVNGGKNTFLESRYLLGVDMDLPATAYGALRAVGEHRSSRLMQAVTMKFDHPEVAAIEYAGKTVFVTGPAQLMTNKMRQVLMSYSPGESRKMTGDFSHLLDAAASIYPEKTLLQHGRQALQRNELLYKKEFIIPWEKTAENGKFVDFLRKVLESEQRNGSFLKGLKIDPTDSMTAMRLFEKHQRTGDKAAIAKFINSHSDFVRKLDVRGSAEHAMYRAQGGRGKASETLFVILDDIPATAKSGMLKDQLRELSVQLSKTSNLPQLHKTVLSKTPR